MTPEEKAKREAEETLHMEQWFEANRKSHLNLRAAYGIQMNQLALQQNQIAQQQQAVSRASAPLSKLKGVKRDAPSTFDYSKLYGIAAIGAREEERIHKWKCATCDRYGYVLMCWECRCKEHAEWGASEEQGH